MKLNTVWCSFLLTLLTNDFTTGHKEDDTIEEVVLAMAAAQDLNALLMQARKAYTYSLHVHV